jgi:hypothetical protein
MVAKEKEDENYRPYDSLRAIGFTKDEAKSFLAGIEEEEAAATQLPPDLKKAPEIEIKFQAQRAELHRRRLKIILPIVSGYAFAVCLYVTAAQFFHPEWIYGPFATWLPIRMDYVWEAAFVSSFILITAITMRYTKRSIHHRRLETDQNQRSDSNPQPR